MVFSFCFLRIDPTRQVASEVLSVTFHDERRTVDSRFEVERRSTQCSPRGHIGYHVLQEYSLQNWQFYFRPKICIYFYLFFFALSLDDVTLRPIELQSVCIINGALKNSKLLLYMYNSRCQFINDYFDIADRKIAEPSSGPKDLCERISAQRHLRVNGYNYELRKRILFSFLLPIKLYVILISNKVVFARGSHLLNNVCCQG